MTRAVTAQAPPEVVDWALAERVASRIGGRAPVESSLRAALEDATRRAQELVAEFTGLYPTDDRVTARTLVLDRAGWARANVAAFRHLLAPITERFASKLAASSMGSLQRGAAGVETGLLLGYMSRRVLGQYDLLVPGDAGPGEGGSRSSDAVYYVGPNILALECRFQLRPREFRLWIALHELTHWCQFRGVPWMRPHFLSLVERALSLVDPDPKRLAEALKRSISGMRQGRRPFEGGGLLAALASPAQLEVLKEAQAFMSLLEGHGNFVMNALGRVHIVGHERMARHLEARRNSGGLARKLHKLIGLDMKMRQYDVGERFVTRVAEVAGPAALAELWVAPDRLPGLPELDDPLRWLARVGA